MLKCKNSLIFFCTRLCKRFSWVLCSFPDYLDELKSVPNRGEFSVFSSVVRGNLGNYSKLRRKFDTDLFRKIWGFFCTLPHKFDLITILLVHEILEPNHADHMIGHLAEAKSCNTEKKKTDHTFSNTVTTSTYRAFSGNPSKSSNGIPAYHTPYSYHRSPDTYLHILLYPYCL